MNVYPQRLNPIVFSFVYRNRKCLEKIINPDMIIYFKRFSYPCHLWVKPKYKHEPKILFDSFSLCEQKFWLSGFFPIIWKKKCFCIRIE